MSDFLNTAMSAAALSEASAARSEAAGARAASEERLEGSTFNPFITFEDFGLEDVLPENSGFFGSLFGIGAKKKLVSRGKHYSVKLTDISHLLSKIDGFGTVYTKVYLEERCNLRSEYDIPYLEVLGNITDVQNYINGMVKRG